MCCGGDVGGPVPGRRREARRPHGARRTKRDATAVLRVDAVRPRWRRHSSSCSATSAGARGDELPARMDDDSAVGHGGAVHGGAARCAPGSVRWAGAAGVRGLRRCRGERGADPEARNAAVEALATAIGDLSGNVCALGGRRPSSGRRDVGRLAAGRGPARGDGFEESARSTPRSVAAALDRGRRRDGRPPADLTTGGDRRGRHAFAAQVADLRSPSVSGRVLASGRRGPCSRTASPKYSNACCTADGGRSGAQRAAPPGPTAPLVAHGRVVVQPGGQVRRQRAPAEVAEHLEERLRQRGRTASTRSTAGSASRRPPTPREGVVPSAAATRRRTDRRRRRSAHLGISHRTFRPQKKK